VDAQIGHEDTKWRRYDREQSGSEGISEVKGRDLMVDQFGEVFGLATPATP
jgi:hypothetical protein